MLLKFWLNKPKAFAKVWQERGLISAIRDSVNYLKWLQRDRSQYLNWIKAQQLTASEIVRVRREIEQWDNAPTFSILVPVYNTRPKLLKKAIESVRSQLYPHWQLYLADDCSPSQATQRVLKQYAEEDSRIHVIFLENNGGISKATNAALAAATGDYIALLDHDDELAINALYENAQIIRQHPEADILYSDEDKITESGRRRDPFFKPDWSPEYFQGCMYTCHLGVYRTSLVRQMGGFRSEFDGAQDWDLMLRLTEQSQQVYHIPKVLYHWRLTATSVTAGAEVKEWAYDAAQRALTDMTQRSAYPGHVEELQDAGFYRVRRHLVDQPLVSIIIPSAGTPMPEGDRAHLDNCLESLVTRSTYPNIELVVVDGYDLPPQVLAKVKEVGVNLVRCDEPFNFSMRVNLGVSQSHGDIVVLLNDDVEILTPDWIEAMLELAQQPAIGAVGSKLYFPTGNIQHAGVVLLHGNPGHVLYDGEGDEPGYFFSNLVTRNYLCVTGACLMLRRSVFDEVGGMDEFFPLNYNDVDFCLKLHKFGYRNVFTPFAELIHHESASRPRGVTTEELTNLKDRWMPYLKSIGGDPYYNPNLRLDGSFLL